MHTCPKCGHEWSEAETDWIVSAKLEGQPASGKITDFGETGLKLMHQLTRLLIDKGKEYKGFHSFVSQDEQGAWWAHLSTSLPDPLSNAKIMRPVGAVHRV